MNLAAGQLGSGVNLDSHGALDRRADDGNKPALRVQVRSANHDSDRGDNPTAAPTSAPLGPFPATNAALEYLRARRQSSRSPQRTPRCLF